jgi:hypothetical protein
VFVDKENGILEFLLEHPGQLGKVFVELDSDDVCNVPYKFASNALRNVLETEVDGKKMHDYINDMLNEAEIPNFIKSKLTKIFQKTELN